MMTPESGLRASGAKSYDLVCLSHLRWNFVFQRPQHLLSRCAAERRVFFVEEPIFSPHAQPRLEVNQSPEGVWVVVPHLPDGLSAEAVADAQRTLLNELMAAHEIQDYVLWYYTPMALAFTGQLSPRAIIYDCMDELSAFKGAPPELIERERLLFKFADRVFTGGQSLYEAKRPHHPSVHAFPSSVDVAHFAKAREGKAEPEDQAHIPHPRLGFFGVVDERMDLGLLDGIAALRPDWHLVVIGPVVKIDPADLPKRENIHYLGGKDYKDLPAYISGWDIAMMPFARNESTRFISPTKTPEYLAGGRKVVSTAITDVVKPYEELGLVRIADTPEQFVESTEAALNMEGAATREWLARVDAKLADMSWDKTWAAMRALVDESAAKAERLPDRSDREALQPNEEVLEVV